MGRQPNPVEGVGGSLHYSCSRPKSSVTKPCYFYSTLQTREEMLSSVVLCPLPEEETNVKEHVLNGRFSSLMAIKAADISLKVTLGSKLAKSSRKSK